MKYISTGLLSLVFLSSLIIPYLVLKTYFSDISGIYYFFAYVIGYYIVAFIFNLASELATAVTGKNLDLYLIVLTVGTIPLLFLNTGLAGKAAIFFGVVYYLILLFVVKLFSFVKSYKYNKWEYSSSYHRSGSYESKSDYQRSYQRIYQRSSATESVIPKIVDKSLGTRKIDKLYKIERLIKRGAPGEQASARLRFKEISGVEYPV